MARKFNGSSDHVDIANEANFDVDFADTFSLSAWVNLTSNVAGSVFAKHDPVTLGGWELAHKSGASTPTFQFIIDGTVNQSNTFTTAEWALATWFHVGCTYDGTSSTAGMLIYVNAASQAKTDVANLASGSMLNNLQAEIGARNLGGANNNPSNAAIAQPAFWKGVVLTAANMSALSVGIPPPQVNSANLVSWWPLNGSSPEPDAFGANAGTVTGTTWIDDPTVLISRPARSLPVLQGP